MADLQLDVNGKKHLISDVDSSTPLLWVLRDHLGLTGSKFGCGGGYCGACTVHLDNKPVRSCSIPVSAAANKQLVTIEGLAGSEDKLHPLQEAWIEHDVPQCGYCQAGQIMTAATLLDSNPNPDDDDIDAAMNGNLCRCGTYIRIRRAIHAAAEKLRGDAHRGGDV